MCGYRVRISELPKEINQSVQFINRKSQNERTKNEEEAASAKNRKKTSQIIQKHQSNVSFHPGTGTPPASPERWHREGDDGSEDVEEDGYWSDIRVPPKKRISQDF